MARSFNLLDVRVSVSGRPSSYERRGLTPLLRVSIYDPKFVSFQEFEKLATNMAYVRCFSDGSVIPAPVQPKLLALQTSA